MSNVDVNAVVESLCAQIGEQARRIAVLEAMVRTSQKPAEPGNEPATSSTVICAATCATRLVTDKV